MSSFSGGLIECTDTVESLALAELTLNARYTISCPTWDVCSKVDSFKYKIQASCSSSTDSSSSIISTTIFSQETAICMSAYYAGLLNVNTTQLITGRDGNITSVSTPFQIQYATPINTYCDKTGMNNLKSTAKEFESSYFSFNLGNYSLLKSSIEALSLRGFNFLTCFCIDSR